MHKPVTHQEKPRSISPHFQRSINVTYDAGNTDYIGGYIPTDGSANALADTLQNTQKEGRDRAHVFHAPYGSGKSLLSLVLSATISHDSSCESAVDTVLDRLHRHYPDQGDVIASYWQSNRRLLPVILSGDEGTLTTALTRGLTRALSNQGLADLRPRTQFKAAEETIALWQRQYPAAYHNLDTLLYEFDLDVEELIEQLTLGEPKSLELFSQLYPKITAGAQFDKYAGVSLADAYHATAKALHDANWDGIVVVWDEFGRFMEAKAGEAFGNEAALLQDFAEFCNRSGDNQVHLILVTHRQLATYASDLPTSYQQEWARIAERFRSHDVTSDPAVVYRLITEAFETTNEESWSKYKNNYADQFRTHTAHALELELFPDHDDIVLRQQVIEQTWPLHPLTVYALPRLSSQVAQNERTLFTFLAAKDDNTLQAQFDKHTTANNDFTWWTVNVDTAWDYFADGIRMDAKPGGTHAIWSGVIYALGKVTSQDFLSQQIVKAMGVLTIIGEVNTQKDWDTSNRIAPSTELIAWAIGIQADTAQAHLDRLAQRRVVNFRQADGYWTFVRGSDVDIEHEVSSIIAKKTPSRLQLRQLLENSTPLPFHLPRGHNVQRGIVRYFHSIYRWANELEAHFGSDEALKRLGGNQGYADGIAVYVLALSTVELDNATTTIQNLPKGRSIYVIPARPLLLMEPLQDLFALRELQNNPQFLERDRERLPRELEFFIEDAERRLRRALQPLLEHQGTNWYFYKGGEWQKTIIQHNGQISRLLSNLCEKWFSETPILNNESLNVNKPSKQQRNASEKVIDHLLRRQDNEVFPFDLDLNGYGPDRLALRTLLVQTKLLQPIKDTEIIDDEPQQWQLSRPHGSELARVWDLVHEFLDSAIEEEQEVEPLIDRLQLPPYGLRLGVLPVILATIMRPRMQVVTLRQNRQAISPITGEAFSNLVYHPEEFSIEVGIWDERRAALWEVLENRIYSFLASQEHSLQPLSYLSIGLLRWLQSLPRYCRDTQQINEEALSFRVLIRKAQRDPARVLLYDLLDLLEDIEIDWNDLDAAKQTIRSRLAQFMDEIADAYQALRYDLDRFADQEFGAATGKRLYEGEAILKSWLAKIDNQVDESLESFRFSDALVQRFVNALTGEGESSSFWERMSHAILGVSTTDWNDRSVSSFKHSILEAKERLQRELFEITEEDDTIELRVHQTGGEESVYLFRPSALSKQGQFILENFKSTMAIAGRPLSPDEKRQLALAFLNYILDGDSPDNERKNRSLRGRI